jgi:hypothetical protein
MMNTRLKQNLAGILVIVGTLALASAIAIAADYNFAGTWKGTYTAAAPTPGTPAGGAPSAGTATAAPAAGTAPTSSDGPSGGAGRTKGGGGASGGGFGGAGGGFPSSGPQKITMRVKVNKEKDKATGNFTMGSSMPEDIREGKIAGNKLTFKTGTPPGAIYDYDAVLIGEDLTVTRTAEGGRGGRPQTFTLKTGK